MQEAGISELATAPAPSLSVVREFQTDGPVTRTLIPMAALDDIVGVVVFFTVISVVSVQVSAQAMPIWSIVLTPILPLVLGVLVGIPAGCLLKKYLGFTLLPHSGVSLVFTGIAVSTLSPSAPAEPGNSPLFHLNAGRDFSNTLLICSVISLELQKRRDGSCIF